MIVRVCCGRKALLDSLLHHSLSISVSAIRAYILLSLLQSQQNWTHLYTICNGIRDICTAWSNGSRRLILFSGVCAVCGAYYSFNSMCSTCVLVYVPNTSVCLFCWSYLFIYLFIFYAGIIQFGIQPKFDIYTHTGREGERKEGSGKFFQWTISGCATGKRRSKNKSFRIFNVQNTLTPKLCEHGQVHCTPFLLKLLSSMMTYRWLRLAKVFFGKRVYVRVCVSVAWTTPTTTIKTTTMASRTKSTLEQNVNRMVWLDLHEIRISSYYSMEVCVSVCVAMCWMKLKFAP